MNNALNVTAGKPNVGGAMYLAPLGTALPTDASSVLSSAWQGLGYVSEDGVTNNNTPESDNVKAWGGDTVLTLQTSKDDTFTFTLIEAMNINVLKSIYGEANVEEVNGVIKVTANSKIADQFAWVIEMTLKGGVLKRIVIPIASITELGEIAYTDSDAVGYEATITAVPDSAGNTHYEYIEGNVEVAYPVVVTAGENGVAFANVETAKAGDTVYITAIADSGYTFDAWDTTDVTLADEATTSFTMPAKRVTIEATFTA